MSDNNVVPLHPRKKKLRKRIIQLTAALCVLVLVVAIVVIAVQNDLTDIGAVRRYFRYRNASNLENFGTYSYDAHNANRYAAYSEGLALASVGGLQLLDDYTGEIYSFHESMSSPAVVASEDYVLIYDVGGTRLVEAHATRGELVSLKEEAPLVDACLSASGAMCYISSEGNYKAVIPVYNEQQQRIYVWYSATAYFNQCAMTDDAKILAAVSIGQTDAVFESKLVLLHTDSAEVQETIPLGDVLVYELQFVTESVICAWTEKGLVFISDEGVERGRYEPTATIEMADLNGSGFAAVWLQSNLAGEESCVVSIGTDAQPKGEQKFSGRILDVSACGSYIAVLSADRLCIYDETMQLYAETTETYGSSQVLQRADGSAVLVSSGSATLYIP